MRRNLNKTVAYFKKLLIHACWVLATCAVVPSAVAEIRGLPDSKAPSAVEVEMGAQEFLKINMEKIRNNYYLVDLQVSLSYQSFLQQDLSFLVLFGDYS